MAIEDKNINTLPQGNIEENNTIIGTDSLGFAVGYTFKKLIAWITNELEKANLKKVEDVLTMAELRTKVGVAGQYKNLLGYYEAGDKPPLLYQWVEENAVDDGGSSIVVGSGYWNAKLNEEYINILHFGAKTDGTLINESINLAVKINKSIYIPKGISLKNIIEVKNIDYLNIWFNKIASDVYRSFKFTNCNNIKINFFELDGLSKGVVGITFDNCKQIILNYPKVINLGNLEVNQVRGIEFNGDCSFTYINNPHIENFLSKSVACGISFAEVDNLWSNNIYINNGYFKNIYPKNDSDGIKTLQLGKETNINISNCYFENCSKRALKLQSRGNYIRNIEVYGDCVIPVDFQDGHGVVENLYTKISSMYDSHVFVQNYNVEIINCDLNTTISDADLLPSNRLIDARKASWVVETEGYLYIKNIRNNKSSSSRIGLENLNLNINGYHVQNTKHSYMIDLTNSPNLNLSAEYISRKNSITPLNGVFGATNGIVRLNVKNNKNCDIRVFDGAFNHIRNIDVEYMSLEKPNTPNISNIITKGMNRYFYTNTEPFNSSYYYNSKKGDIAYNSNPTDNIYQWICVSDGSEADIGEWVGLKIDNTL